MVTSIGISVCGVGAVGGVCVMCNDVMILIDWRCWWCRHRGRGRCQGGMSVGGVGAVVSVC